MCTITRGHQRLLDVLVQLACRVAMVTTNDPHERVPEDLKDIMRALQRAGAGDLSHRRSRIVDRCHRALIFVASREPDLFPKPFARAIVHELKSVQLWNIACDVVGLSGVEGIDVARISDDYFGQGHRYVWDCLNAHAPDATERFIEPVVFNRILRAYEEQVEQEQ
jgi:hypothetical protein